jgi:hypothetical protein
LLFFGEDGDNFQQARRTPAKDSVSPGIRLQGPARQRMDHFYFPRERPFRYPFDIVLDDLEFGVGDIVDITLRAP